MTDTDFSPLTTLSPLDGRYHSHTSPLANIFSEYSLLKHRVTIELQYVLFLVDKNVLPKISQKHRKQLLSIIQKFDQTEARKIKVIEQTTKHDVKAVEYYLHNKLKKFQSPLSSYIHICLTSEDVNNLAYSLMLKHAQQQVILPQLQQLLQQLSDMADRYADIPMLSRTHGQAAVPTTVGKELVTFGMRLLSELQMLESVKIEGKLTGAVGNFNAHMVAFPKADWLQLSQEFVDNVGLAPQMFTTQTLPVESYSRLFSSLIRVNGILVDFSQDMWQYISRGYFRSQKSVGQVGSSTMPHKVNPIDFENAEGNLGLANSLLTHFVHKLPVSRLQRDLSDSTVKRNFGAAFGYSSLAYVSLEKGLQKLSVNRQVLSEELDDHWEILSEAYQVIIKTAGESQAYEQLRQLTQGKNLTKKDMHTIIDQLDIAVASKKRLKKITPINYIGAAKKLTQQAVQSITVYSKGKL